MITPGHISKYLCDWVEGVCSLGGVEVGVEDSTGQLAADQDRLHRLTHGLFGAQGQIKTSLRASLTEADVVLDVHWDCHQTGEEARQQIL